MNRSILAFLALCTLLLVGCSGATGPRNDLSSPGTTSSASLETPGPDTDPLLEMTVQMYGLTETPKADLIREVAPAQWQETHVKCLEDAGWFRDAEDSYIYADSQEEAFGIATYVCLIQFPKPSKYRQPMSEEHYRRGYEHYRDYTIPCLTKHGIETAELPSYEVFQAGIGTPNEYHPLKELDSDFDNQSSLECELEIPLEVLYGTD